MSSETQLLQARAIACLRAPNPGPLTLSGTNTWLVGSAPAWVIDPGPLIEEHLAALCGALERRGGLGGVALTHAHGDHSASAPALLERYCAPLAAAQGDADVALVDGVRFGPFEALATPGHAADHVALLAHGACFSGDAVLGEGSVFISPYRGAMAAYLRALERLAERRDFTLICPGHGPVVADGHAKLAEYLEHRRARERALLGALQEGRRTVPELLAGAWPEVPSSLHAPAAATLAAHLDKLEEEGRLPDGVERPPIAGAPQAAGAER